MAPAPSSHRDAAARPEASRLVFAALGAALLLAGCPSESGTGGARGTPVPVVADAPAPAVDRAPERTPRRAIHPLVGFRSEDPVRVAAQGRAVARWVPLEAGLRRAIDLAPGATLAVRIDPPAGAAIRAGLAVRGEGAAPIGGQAIFRVRLSATPDDAGVTLGEQVIVADRRGDGAIDVTVPADWRGPGWVTLSAEWPAGPPGASAPGTAPQLLWIEPRVEWEVPESEPTGEPTPRPWNVVVVTSDTTRQDDLGCYGGPARTPRLDALAAEGVVFTAAYTVACVTTPSHASLMTASHASDHRVYDNSSVLPDERITLAEELHRRGWATAGLVSGLPLIRALGFSQGFDWFDDALALRHADQPARRLLRERPADETVDLFVDWLRARPVRPFFAWLHLFDAHQPYAPPASFLPPGADVSDDPELARIFANPDGSVRRIRPSEVAGLSAERRARVDAVARARYRGELAFIDSQVGRLVDALKAAGAWDRTLFVFVADHGENFGDRGDLAWAHAGLFHDVTRIPLLVRLPGGRAAGRRSPELVGNMDIAPTILDALGMPRPAVWTGRSFLPGIEAPEAWRGADSIVIEAPREKEVSVRTPAWMYREMAPGVADDADDGDGPAPWRRRFGYRPDESEQLFDLAVDPLEHANVAAARRDEVQRMKTVADAFLAAKPRTGRAAALGGGAHREALRALGYAD